MAESENLLMVQFLAWVADRPRNHADVMDAWRSTCPRMSIWEDAIIDGLVALDRDQSRNVRLTPAGAAMLARAAASAAIRTSSEAARPPRLVAGQNDLKPTSDAPGPQVSADLISSA